MLMEVYLSPLMETSVFPEFSGGGVGGFSFTKGNSSKCPFATTIWSLLLCNNSMPKEYGN